MQRATKHLLFIAGVLSFFAFTGQAAALSEIDLTSLPFNIPLSRQTGTITHFYRPSARENRLHPDFILIQNVHCNQHAQYTISHILKQLKTYGLVPASIAVEGAVGPIDLHVLQNDPDEENRKAIADELVSQGTLTGALHFALSEGKGDLFGVEEPDLYKTSVSMYRKSFEARTDLKRKLDKLSAALDQLKTNAETSAMANELSEDIRVIHQLLAQHLTPAEVSQVLNRAVVSLDHLKSVLPGGVDQSVLRPVSAAVDFYALALLRDEALLTRSLLLRQREQQETTVIVVGGFHTAGLMKRLKDRGFSYVVITPRITSHSSADERLYVERILGRSLPTDLSDAQADMTSALDKAQANWLAEDLRKKLVTLKFKSPAIHDIFTAMDQPWIQPSVQNALINQRAQILETAVTSAQIY